MTKSFKKFFLASFFAAQCCFYALPVAAQTDSMYKPASIPVYRVGIFAPLYLDSVFNNNNFRYKQGIPKFIVPAVEFVQGAQIAFDSMKVNNADVKAFIYDTKSYSQGLATLIRNKKLDSLDLIIGSVRDADYKQLADFALAKHIPFISATHPNDGGITSNPFTVIVNSTLKAHCEGMYAYLLQNHGTDLIFLCRQQGLQEDKVAGYFKQLNEKDGRALLNIQTINKDSGFTKADLQNKLDSNRQCVVIGASLDESFAKNLASSCYKLFPTYPIKLIGMPNWDGFASLKKKEDLEGFPVYYTTPYYNGKWDSYSKMIATAYMKKFKIKPTDNAYKGFEAAQLFTQMLVKHPADMINHINDKSEKVFCDYNFRPVMLKNDNTTPDYFENKHLYFIKILDGQKARAW